MVDYAICSHGLCEKMEEVMIGEQLHDLKSDHKPIYLILSWNDKQHVGRKNHIEQPLTKGKINFT